MNQAAKGNTKMTINIERVYGLLHIVEKCSGHSGKLSSLSNAAMKELLEVNEAVRQEAIAEAQKQAKAQAELDAKAAVKREDDIRREEATPRRSEEPNIRPSIYPGDSETATIADRRI